MRIATLAVIVRDGKILLGLKRGKPLIGAGTLNGPGGHLEPGETILECVIRETEEEVSIRLEPEKVEKVAVITFYSGGVPDFEVHTYRTNEFTGEPHETESMIPEWHDIDSLPVDRMLESDREWFPQLARGEKFNANVYYRSRARDFDRIEFLPFSDHV